MKAINEAIEGARDFQGFMDKIIDGRQQIARQLEQQHAPKPLATCSATPNTGFGQRVAGSRAKAKAASKARAAQRMRAKGKR